jgi:hypothetical protein
MARCGLDSFDSRWRPVVGCCEHGNKHVDFIKCGEFVD